MTSLPELSMSRIPQCAGIRALTISLVLAAFALGAVATSSASAAGSYEQVNTINAAPGEPSGAAEAWATAVNETGAGGVAAGTVYVLGDQPKEPGKNLRWYAPGATTPSGEVPVDAGEQEYLAIDQRTGQIVTLSNNQYAPVVSVYEPDGSGPIEQFGEIDQGKQGPDQHDAWDDARRSRDRSGRRMQHIRRRQRARRSARTGRTENARYGLQADAARNLRR